MTSCTDAELTEFEMDLQSELIKYESQDDSVSSCETTMDLTEEGEEEWFCIENSPEELCYEDVIYQFSDEESGEEPDKGEPSKDQLGTADRIEVHGVPTSERLTQHQVLEDPYQDYFDQILINAKAEVPKPPKSAFRPEFKIRVPKHQERTIIAELLRHPTLERSLLENPTEETYALLTNIARNLEMHPEKLRFNALHLLPNVSQSEKYLAFARKIYDYPALWDVTHKDYQRTDLRNLMWKSLDTELGTGIEKMKCDLARLKEMHFARWSLALEGTDEIERSLTAIELYEVLEKMFSFEVLEQNVSERVILAKKIYSYEILWNRTHPEYSNTVKRNAILTAIGTQLELTIEEVKQRWACLRDSYYRRRVRFKSLPMSNDQIVVEEELYNLLEQMLWDSLDDNVEGLCRESNFQQTVRNVSTLQIIELIYGKEVLWNKQDPRRQDSQAIKAAYSDIAVRLHMATGAIQKQWFSIHKSFCSLHADYLHGNIFKDDLRLQNPVYQLMLKMDLMKKYEDGVTETEGLNDFQSLSIAERIHRKNIIWNQKHHEFNDWWKRNAAFESVAEQLGMSKGNLLHQWRTMREIFWKRYIRGETRRGRPSLSEPLRSGLLLMCGSIDEHHVGRNKLEIARLIYESSVIWNNKHPSYADTTEREIAFETIAIKLGIELTTLRSSWNYLHAWYWKIVRKGQHNRQNLENPLFPLLDRMLNKSHMTMECAKQNYSANLSLARAIHQQEVIWSGQQCSSDAEKAAFNAVGDKLGLPDHIVKLEWGRLERMFDDRLYEFSTGLLASFSMGDPLYEVLEIMLMKGSAREVVQNYNSNSPCLDQDKRSRLAAEISKHGCIVDPSHHNFREPYERQRAWDDISSAVEINQERAKAEWFQAIRRVREEQHALASGLVTAELDLDSLILLADRVAPEMNFPPSPGPSKRPLDEHPVDTTQSATVTGSSPIDCPQVLPQPEQSTSETVSTCSDLANELHSLLRKTQCGMQLLEQAAAGSLSNLSRLTLASIIAEHHIQSGRESTEEVMRSYADAVVHLFKFEKKEVYFTPRGKRRRNPGGKIYQYISIIRQKTAKRKRQEEALHSSKQRRTDSETQKSSEALDWLLMNIEPWGTTLKNWTLSFDCRRVYLRKHHKVRYLLEKYPHYYDSKGYQLIDIDFAKLFKTATDGMLALDSSMDKLVTHVTMKHMDKATADLAVHLLEQNISNDSKICTVLLLLNNFLLPTKATKKYRPSRLAAQNDTVLFVKSPSQIEQKLLESYTEYEKMNIPKVAKLIFVGTDATTLAGQFYVGYDKLLYQVESAGRALDVLIKFHLVFGIKFSKFNRLLWHFLCQYLYQVPGQTPSRSVNILIELLRDKR